MYEYRDNECLFCKIQNSADFKNDVAIAFEDKYPVTKNHTLIIPLRHVSSYFELGTYERNACWSLLGQVRNVIMNKDKSVTGFNVGFNDGIDAGQTVFHCHIYLIPKRKGDVPNPSGGIRNIL